MSSSSEPLTEPWKVSGEPPTWACIQPGRGVLLNLTPSKSSATEPLWPLLEASWNEQMAMQSGTGWLCMQQGSATLASVPVASPPKPRPTPSTSFWKVHPAPLRFTLGSRTGEQKSWPSPMASHLHTLLGTCQHMWGKSTLKASSFSLQ
ncbi:hypothetical protein P7K49_024664, partial [Saguinus oedipus]